MCQNDGFARSMKVGMLHRLRLQRPLPRKFAPAQYFSSSANIYPEKVNVEQRTLGPGAAPTRSVAPGGSKGAVEKVSVAPRGSRAAVEKS